MICDNISVSPQGRLLFAGQDVVTLAQQYGTPLYLMDENRLRANCRAYRQAFFRHFGGNSRPLYASKVNCFKLIYEIMQEEQMGIDVVSSGEIYTARQAGYDLSQAYFHGNNKTDDDIRYAMDCGVGFFVADSTEEVLALETEAARRGITQKILLRLSPGIDPHTYEAIATGKVDSKFGSAIETGQAELITRLALSQPHLQLEGFHCHVGSQVIEEDVFERCAVIMLEFIATMREKLGYLARQLDLGGGYGVRYLDTDPALDIPCRIGDVADVVHETCRRLSIPEPEIHMEPGRSIAADAGMTLYTVGTVKRIPGYKNYVSVDGGMSDNPRYALYRAPYTCLLADRVQEQPCMACSVVGRCCESGDIIQEHVFLPADVRRGDTLAVCTTGAYNYSMASNYNRLPRPAIVMLREGTNYLAVRRESFADLCRNEL